MEFTLLFLRIFFWPVYLMAPLLAFLGLLIIVFGLIVGKFENWNKFDTIYWAFITAATVGYGDIRPTRRPSKTLSIVIALIGMVFTGIVIAVSVNAASLALDRHVDPMVIESIKEKLN